MKKILEMIKVNLKTYKKLLVTFLIIILSILILLVVFMNKEDVVISILLFAGIFEKLIIPLLIYFIIKNYKSSLSNSIQVGNSRKDFFITKTLSILVASMIIAVFITPFSYYLAELGKFDWNDSFMPLFIGYYEPLIPNIFMFGSILPVTLITILIYNLFGQLSFLTAAFYNRFGFLKLFITFTALIYSLCLLNNYIISKTRLDIMNIILGFTGISINYWSPIFYISLFGFITSLLTYIIVSKTEIQ